MEFHIEYFKTSLLEAFHYVPVTLKLTVISFILSLIIGFVIGAIRHYEVPVLSKVFSIFVTVYMGLPVMVALVLYNMIFLTTYEDFARFFHLSKSIKEVNPIIIGYITLISFYSCHLSETVRGAFRGIAKIQYEAGYAIGMTRLQTLRRIILPQLVPIMIPNLVNSLIGALKGSNLVSAIGVMEVMTAALVPCQETYSYLEGYLAAALVYWMIGIGIEFFCTVLEKQSGKYRKQLV